MKLAIVVNSFPKLSETFILNKVLLLRQAGVGVTVIAQSREKDSQISSEKPEEIRKVRIQYSLPVRKPLRFAFEILWILIHHPRKFIHLLGQAKKLHSNWDRAMRAFLLALPIKQSDYDIIHFEMSGIAVAYLDALPLLKPAKLVTSCRGAAEQITPLIDPTRGEKLRQVFKEMDLVHCVSEDILRTAEIYGLNRAKAFVNFPSIDPEKFHREFPYPEKTIGPYKLITVGRLHWKKGHEFGLLTIKELIDRGYNVEYSIVGDGPEMEKLLFMIHNLGIADHVSLMGGRTTKEVKALLEQADVFLLPSLSEGISNAALEAMAMELPVVSTTAGGMAEAITDEQDGLLVPPNQPIVMAEKIAWLLENPGARKSMGFSGRKTIQNTFTIRDQIDKYLSKYKNYVR